MPLITYFINRILEKEKKDKNILFSFQCLNTIENLDNDMKSFYYIYLNSDVGLIRNIELLEKYYVKAKKVSNCFRKLVRRYRWKKARKYEWETDLFMVHKLDDLPENQKITILENSTKYSYKLSDIINIWDDALKHRQGLFSSPQHPKNPHTNRKFELCNLYNLYLALFNSTYHIPMLITRIFHCGFDLDVFGLKYLPFLRECAIDNYFQDASDYEMYEYIFTMVEKYRTELNNAYLSSYASMRQRLDIVKRMKSWQSSCIIIMKGRHVGRF